MPAGYTYFGQFVDHDLTFDSTSSLNPADRPPQGTHVPSNLRTPRFDLDNVYGDGPDAQPFMYDSDGATLLTGENYLLRAPNGRAIIGDKRNDENSIVCQIQLGIIRYHDRIVAALKSEDPEGQNWNTPHDPKAAGVKPRLASGGGGLVCFRNLLEFSNLKGVIAE